MKHLNLLIPILIIPIIIAVVATVMMSSDSNLVNDISFANADFSGCKVEVLENEFSGIKTLGELNSDDTKYFIQIIKAIKLGQKIENYQMSDGENAKEYLITLSDGQEIYFGQGFGEANGYENACFVHINEDVYTVTNPAVLNALYVINENFYFYNR